MSIRVTCECGKQLRVQDKLAGKRVKCPGCGKVLHTPRSLPPTVAAPADNPQEFVESPAPRRLWPWFAAAGGAMLALAVGLAIGFLPGNSKQLEADGPGRPMAGKPELGAHLPLRNDSSLRYTIRDVNGVRASVKRESVLKTLGMSEQQIKEWANEPAGMAEQRAVGYDLIKAPGHTLYTITNPNGRASSQNKDSASKARQILLLLFQKASNSNSPEYQKYAEQLRDWVKDENAAGEGRSAQIAGPGYTEIIWRGASGKIQYTFTSNFGYITSQNRESAWQAIKLTLPGQPASSIGSGVVISDKALRERAQKNEQRIRQWAKDESAAGEGRSASIAMNGYLEMISRGVMEEPPYLPR